MDGTHLYQLILEALVPGVTQGCIFALVALGFVVVFSVSRLYHLMIGEFGMLGGMIAATLSAAKVPLVGSIAVGIAAAILLSAVIWYGLLSRPYARGASAMNLKLVTIALMLVSMGGAYLIWGTYYKELPYFTTGSLRLLGVSINPQAPWVLGILLVVVGGLKLLFDHTLLGKAFRASADSSVGAQIVGIDHRAMAGYAFLLAGGLGAVAGIIVAPITMAYYGSGLYLTLHGLLAAMVGGPNRVEGAIIGGLVLGVVESLAGAFISSQFMTAIALGLFVVILILRPQGILGTREHAV